MLVVGVGDIEVDGEATVVVTMATLDLVGRQCPGLVFSNIFGAILTQTILFEMLNVNCAILLDIQQNIVLNLLHSTCRLLLTWHFAIPSSRL